MDAGSFPYKLTPLLVVVAKFLFNKRLSRTYCAKFLFNKACPEHNLLYF